MAYATDEMDTEQRTRRRWSPRPPAWFRNVRANVARPATRWSTLGVLALALGAAGTLAYWVRVVTDLPSETAIRNARYAEASVLFSRYEKGEERREREITRYSDQNREWVPLDSISPRVVQALVAAEDRRYYDHWGVDVRRVLSSTAKTLAGSTQGGSTITMQFARNAFPDLADDFALTRKVKEWVLAYSLENVHDKRSILEMYLNTVPFLYNAFGIEAAAQTYFNKHAGDLDAGEAATLVGMLKANSFYNPVDRVRVPERIRRPLRLAQTDRSRERRNVVLDQMVKAGYLDGAVYESMRERPTRLRFKPIARDDFFAPYFAGQAREELEAWAERRGINLYQAGLRVYTTLDPRLQDAAERAVEQETRKLQRAANQQWRSSSYTDSTGRSVRQDPLGRLLRQRPEVLAQFVRQSEEYGELVRAGQPAEAVFDSLLVDPAFQDTLRTRMTAVEAGFIAIEPSTRAIRAYVGGRGFGDKQFDHVADARRQPGSTFKPFVYAAALENGFTPSSGIRDAWFSWRDPVSGDVWRPRNSGRVSGRMFTLREALKWSKNTVTARLITDKRVGPEKVAALARRAGINSPLLAVPSLGLGTSEVTLLELSAAYATFADGGRYRAPMILERIEDRDGNVVVEFRPKPSRAAVEPKAAYDLLGMMQGVVQGGTGTGMNRYGIGGFTLGGKTGTTQNAADGWFMLVHPNLVMGAWVGFDSPTIAWRGGYQEGSRTALPIVGAFFERAKRDAPAILDPDAVFAKPGDPPRRPRADAATSEPARETRRARPRPRPTAPVERAPETPSEDAGTPPADPAPEPATVPEQTPTAPPEPAPVENRQRVEPPPDAQRVESRRERRQRQERERRERREERRGNDPPGNGGNGTPSSGNGERGNGQTASRASPADPGRTAW